MLMLRSIRSTSKSVLARYLAGIYYRIWNSQQCWNDHLDLYSLICISPDCVDLSSGHLVSAEVGLVIELTDVVDSVVSLVIN